MGAAPSGGVRSVRRRGGEGGEGPGPRDLRLRLESRGSFTGFVDVPPTGVRAPRSIDRIEDANDAPALSRGFLMRTTPKLAIALAIAGAFVMPAAASGPAGASVRPAAASGNAGASVRSAAEAGSAAARVRPAVQTGTARANVPPAPSGAVPERAALPEAALQAAPAGAAPAEAAPAEGAPTGAAPRNPPPWPFPPPVSTYIYRCKSLPSDRWSAACQPPAASSLWYTSPISS